MAIDLLHSFINKGQSITSNQKSETTQSTQNTIPQNMQVLRAIHALKAGQTLQGEILSVKGDNVQLAIMKEVIIDARLAQSMNLTPGAFMSFQVKSNNSSGLSIVPLFTNTAADPNALKALDMAGIPVNDKTLEMVQTLMKRGLPIDKQSLQEVYRDVVVFKDASVGNIITLRQMNMPVTSENLQQLSLYENNQHFLADTFSDIGSAIGQQLKSWMAEGKVETARSFIQNLQQIFGQNTEQTVTQGQTAETVSPNSQDTANVLLSSGEMPKEVPINQEKPIVISEEMLNPKAEKETLDSKNLPQIEEAGKQGMEKADSKPAQPREGLLQWDRLLEMFSKEKNPEKVSSYFEKLWDQDVKAQWMMEPETVMNKENVQKFYEKLTHQLKQVEALFDERGSNNNPAAKAVQNTVSNLDFMNQINQMHAYIQIPLKLADKYANGELYVYTNKKSLAKKDGKVTALLHLDMAYLGKIDVYVAMEDRKVSTQFYLEKEEYLDFLEEHMDLLTTRLNKRGYDCSIKTSIRAEKEEESVMKKIENSQNSPVLLSTQAFDMRA